MKLTNGKFPIVIAMECNPRQLLNMCDKYNLDKNNFYYLSSDQVSKIGKSRNLSSLQDQQ